MRPATRYGRDVVFPGGHTVRLSRWQHLLFALGIRTHLSVNPHQERRSA